MRWKYGLALGILICLNAVAMGQTGGTGGGSPAAAPVPLTPADAIMTRVVVKLNGGGPLKSVLKQIRDAVPNLNVVVSQDPGVNEPVMPQLDVNNTSVEQIFNLIEATCPGVVVQRIEGQGPPLLLVHITRPNDGMVGVARQLTSNSVEAASPLFVYRLTAILNSLVASKPAAKDARPQAMNDVMSLMQSALDQMKAEAPPGRLEVHPQTDMLIFKGTSEQVAALEQVLKALEPTDTENAVKRMSEDFNQERIRFNDSLATFNDTKKQLDEARMQLAELKAQMQAEQEMRARMTEQRPATRPRE